MNIEIMEIVPLLALQKTMLYQIISQLSCQAYCEQWRYKITGKLDIETMKRAWKDTMDYFDVLHGIFQWKNRKEPVFIIQKESKVICHTYYLQKNIKECEKQMWADEIALREYLNPVDLEDAPIRIAISIFDDSHCEWIVTSNHILFDGWSNSLIMNDWIGRYRTYCCHQIPDHLEQSLSYSDYVRYVCQEQINQQHTEFWQNYLRGCASLPTSTQRGRGKHQVEKIPLSKHEVEQINFFCKVNGCTLSVVLYIAWALLLYTNKTNNIIITGVTVSGRNPLVVPGVDKIAGLLAKTLPLRIDIGHNLSLRKIINQVIYDLIEIEEHMHVDPKIWLEILPNIQNHYREGLTIQNYPVQKYSAENDSDCTVEFYHSYFYSDMNFAVSVKTFQNPIILEVAYCSDLYSLQKVHQRMKKYRDILQKITRTDNSGLDVPLLDWLKELVEYE